MIDKNPSGEGVISAKHSPGPWKWVNKPKTFDSFLELHDCNGAVVLDAEGEGVQQHVSVGDADARLIEAAPELLEELREAVDCIDPGKAGHRIGNNCSCVGCRGLRLIARIVGEP